LHHLLNRCFSGNKNDKAVDDNKPAQECLAVLLSSDGKLTDKKEVFDYNTLTPIKCNPTQGAGEGKCLNHWLKRAFNHYAVPMTPLVDGLQASMGTFTLHALAKGFVKPKQEGKHTVHLTGCSVFVYDTFNFESDEPFLFWSCQEKNWSYIQLPRYTFVKEADFQDFRNKHGKGGNFVVLSELHSVENFVKYSYSY
jgi:hypothetical protein